MNQVTYKCQDCQKEFEVDQGSKQRYCPDCLIKRIKRVGKKGDRK